MNTMAVIIRRAVETTPYRTDDPATHQDPYENAAAALTVAGFGSRAREQWTFTGQETLWDHYTFLVWTRDDGKRFARWVK